MSNPVVFCDMTIGGAPAGRIEMTLRADVVPKTAEVSASRGCAAPRQPRAVAAPRRADHARAAWCGRHVHAVRSRGPARVCARGA